MYDDCLYVQLYLLSGDWCQFNESQSLPHTHKQKVPDKKRHV